MVKRIILSFSFLFAIYAALGVLFYIFQANFIYFPNKQNFDDCEGFADAEKIDWNGTRMYVKDKGGKWVVFYHGNAGSACDRSFLKTELEKFNYSYVFVEYAGYSNDNKKPNQRLLLQDARNANDYLLKRNPAKVTIIGESLGTALAIYHSYLNQPSELVLISPFNNLSAVAKNALPIYPAGLLLMDKYQSEDWIKDIANVTILHGTKDTTIPVSLGRNLFDRVRSNSKRFLPIEGAGHNDTRLYDLAISMLNDSLDGN